MSLASHLHRVLHEGRRRRELARLRAAARLAGVDLDLVVASTARLGRLDARFTSDRSCRLHIGAHTVVDDIELRFDGGAVEIGEWCELRAGVRVMAGGRLELQGQNIVSWGSVIHCDESVVLGRQSTFGEYVTISDSTHEHVAGRWHVDQIRTAPVRIGVDTWVGAKATITRGVEVGDHCVVAAGAVVTRLVPDRHVALGVPATSRPLPRADHPTS